MDVRFFKPFVEATIKTLKVQCNTDATHEKPFIKGTKPQPDFDLAAVIALTSNAFNGTITLSFTKSTFLGVMSGMLGEKYEEITPELEDGAAELLNIIFGQAKLTLTQEGYTVEKAIPTVIRGAGLKTKIASSQPVIVLPFATASGIFEIEIVAEGKSF
jgi:CheY-specific phosphatase CheX